MHFRGAMKNFHSLGGACGSDEACSGALAGWLHRGGFLLLLAVMFLVACQDDLKGGYIVEDSGLFSAQRYALRFGDFVSQNELIVDFVAPSSDKFCFGFLVESGPYENEVKNIELSLNLSSDAVRWFGKKGGLSEWVRSNNANGEMFYYGGEEGSTCVDLKKGRSYRIHARATGLIGGYEKMKSVAFGGGWK